MKLARSRRREAVRLRGERARLQRFESRAHMIHDLVRRRLKNNISKEIFSAQKERKEIEILMIFEAYLCWRLITKVLEHSLDA